MPRQSKPYPYSQQLYERWKENKGRKQWHNDSLFHRYRSLLPFDHPLSFQRFRNEAKRVSTIWPMSVVQGCESVWYEHGKTKTHGSLFLFLLQVKRPPRPVMVRLCSIIYIYIMIKTKRFIKLYWYGIELCMCYCSITQTDRSIAEMLARHPNKKQHGCRAPGDPRVVLCQSGATKRTKNETSADILDRC